MSTSSRPPFIVVGTGRCGTVSIAEIVNMCPNTFVTHEEHLLPWYKQGDPMIGTIIRDGKQHQKDGITRGWVGFQYLPHIGEIRSALRDLKVVRLKRDKEGTVKSFCRFASFMIRPCDKRKWEDNKVGRARQYVVTFPVIDAWTPKQAFEFYWEYYTARAASISEPVFDIEMTDLNDPERLKELFSFLEMPEADWILDGEKHHHSWRDLAQIQGMNPYQSETERRILYEQWRSGV